MSKTLIKHIIISLTLALLTMAGTAVGQNDTPFVIKKGDNYLAHVKVGNNYALQATSTFNPFTCLWYSGPTYNPTGYTHNYYFEDDAQNLRFLAAPLQPNATLSLSNSLPSVSMLRNTDQVYYFYNWDPETELNGVPEGGGVAKGRRYYVDTQELCQACGDYAGASWYVPESGATPQCWEVYWIENEGSNWKLSSSSSYNITTNAARYRKVTITEHEKEITAGGLATTIPSEVNYGEDPSTLSATLGSPYSYIPAYTQYVFTENSSESVHNYWGNSDHSTSTPGAVSDVDITSGSATYQWTISGEGEEFLSFSSSANVNTSDAASPTLYYRVENTSGHKTATITVTVTYTDASNAQTTQTHSATVLVKTPCLNPGQAAAPVITYTGAIVSWLPTSDSYTVSWKKATDSDWDSVDVGNVTTYRIMGLDYNTNYVYKVTTECGNNTPTEYPFKTVKEPGLMVGGAIFGGGRMANVGGDTEVVIINCDSIGAIYGGNDIAGEVQGANGSTITLGVAANDPNDYDDDYGTTPNDGKIRVTSVYGGGNGYYAYNGTSFVPATQYYTSETVAVGASVNAMTQAHTVGEVAWTNNGTSPKLLDFPSIVKTAITVTDNKVKVDSIFGGAKNAFLTYNGTNEAPDGSLITINGGTILAVFGGNNFGGKQGYGKHHIVVNGTTTCLTTNQSGQFEAGTPEHQFGREFGIGSIFGGGNKVYGSTTQIDIFGGQTDNVFGGGNSADVYAANVHVNCSLGAYSSNYTFGNTYTNAILTSYTGGNVSIGNIDVENYPWNSKGVYNVRNLYGGNNMESMASVPTVTLTSGSVGTVYGGGNAGDMLASTEGSFDEDDDNSTPAISFDYSTKVILNSANILVDYLYGGCRMSNVDYSTWVQIQNGHVGTVFGGCNVSGDVGSTQVNPGAASGTMDYQEVQGGTYVEASGGTVYKNLYAGGNGFYHCEENFHYVSGINYTDENYVTKIVPTHNQTYANVRTGATIKGNVYAGGNMAPVGFRDYVAPYFPSFPTEAVGWAVVHIYGGTVEGNVFGGGNMADVYGNNDVLVAGGTIAAVYGGNDRTGQVAEFSNRVLPAAYAYATDGYTSLLQPEVHAYVRVVGNPTIQEVYGGGNGDYDYEHGDEVVTEYCDENESGPIQSNTFVDININGGANGGHIGTVYGGGDGVTASGFITVFMNIVEPEPAEDFDNVDVVFGGNNKGNLDLVPDIILLHGQVGTVYGGCNEGAMTAATGVNVGGYPNIGSYVRLRDSYDPDGNGTAPAVTPTIKVTDAVYGGCRMNGVTRNSLVLVEHGDFRGVPLFGGSDISGHVNGDSRVAVVGGKVDTIFGGGNGNYTYSTIEGTQTYNVSVGNTLVASGVSGAPTCTDSGIDIIGGEMGAAGSGNAGNAFGGGWGEHTRTTNNVEVKIGPAEATSWTGLPIIYGDVYGGSALGEVNTGSAADRNTTVNFRNGTLHGNLYGGGLGRLADQANNITAVEAKVYGKVNVNISSSTQAADKCFIDLRDANIYGCNNTNGSPQDDVTVHVYKTAYNFNDYAEGDNYTSQVTPNTYYAIDQVFGGGNQADYAPENGSASSTKKTLVHVHDCSNTIRRVFSGGNAAAATGVSAIIEGGRFDYIFGGGNGEVTAANIGAGGTNLLVEAGVVNHLFGGSNSTGNISGPVITTVSGANYVAAGEGVTNPCNEDIEEFFGGANLANLGTAQDPITINTTIECGSGLIGSIYGGCNLADIVGDVTLTIRGGIFSEAYGGSKGRLAQDAVGQEGDENYQPAVAAKAADIDGNVKLNLEGGTITDAFGGSNINGNITGNITVNVVDFEGDCGLDLTNVYGGGNVTAYTPTSGNPVVNVIHTALTENGTPVGIRGNVYGGGKGTTATVTANPIVNIGYNEATMSTYLPNDLPDGLSASNFNALVSGSVFGGGDAAPVTGSTVTNVYSGEIVQKLVGGGNAANVTGDATLNIRGGLLCSDANIDNVGIYGGCNTTGTVGGNVELNITGTAVIGVEANVVAAQKPVNVHGGGYGQGTAVAGNVTINYGDIAAEESLFPKLFGNLYGGSALGSVNTNGSNNVNLNVLNGSIVSKSVTLNPDHPEASTYYYSGNIFGGGLGRKAQAAVADDPTTTDVDESQPALEAVAAVVNGAVHVNIGDATTPPSSGLRGKATLIGCNVYGCNNQYGSPQDNAYVDVYQTAHTTANLVSGNDYAILRVFGGGNEANYLPLGGNVEKRAHVYIHGCDNTIKYVYGGGNAADALGVESIIEGGRFNEVYGGGNGLVTPANIGDGSVGFIILGGHVNFLFEGSNKQGTIGGTPYVPILPQGYEDDCSSLTVDSYYFGDNEAEHIGDIVNTITCDQASQFNYKYVYAGSRWAVVYGDVKLTVQGGNIRYLFGGSKGYLEDHIPADVRRYPSVRVIDSVNAIHEGYYSANLRAHMVAHPELVGTGGNIELIINGGTIGEVIGGCDELGTVEGKITVIVDEIDSQACPLFIGNVYGANNLSDCVSDFTDPAVPTPKVSIIKGTIGGSAMFHYDETTPTLSFAGNVYGGGNEGKVTSNPKVIVGDGTTGTQATPVTIKGDVFGGGNLGDVIGSPKVVVVPERHNLTFEQPTGGTVTVAYTRGTSVASGDPVGEDVDLRIIATPDAATAEHGYLFSGWTVTTEAGASMEASVEDASAANTLFTMGTGNASLSASFREVQTQSLTLATNPANAGSFKVDGVAHNAGTTMYIPRGATVTVQALHVDGYVFKEWTVAGATLSSTTSSVTTFVMGETAVTLTAVFEPVYTLTLEPDPEGAFTFKVNGANYTGSISYRENTTVTVQAIAASGYTFSNWTFTGTGAQIGNDSQATTSFKIGSSDAVMTAHGTTTR